MCTACGERDSSPVSIAVGEVIGECFEFLQERPQLLKACTGAYVAYGVLSLPLNYPIAKAEAQGDSAALLSTLLSLVVLSSVAHLLFSTGFEVALTRYVGDEQEGGDHTLGETLRTSLLPALGSNFLVGLAVVPGILLCILPGAFLAVALSLAIPAVVLGGCGAVASLSDSWKRTQGERLQLFLVLLVSALVAAGIMLAAWVVQLLLLKILGTVGLMLGLVVNQAGVGLSMTFLLTALVLCYQRLSGRTV